MTADTIALFGTIFAGAAALFAFVSLILIWRQIRLAHDEINMVREDLNYSREASQLVAAQMTELQRRPQLALCASDLEDHIVARPTAENAVVDLYIVNRGSRTSKDISCTFFFPADYLAPNYRYDGAQHVINGISHIRNIFNAPVPECVSQSYRV